MLEERLKQLERRVDQLEAQLDEKKTIAEPPADTQSPGATVDDKMAEADGSSSPADFFSFGENWLNRIGIGLLLFGVAFLFKYSIDQGWLIPPVRSASGLTIGLILLVKGLQLDHNTGATKQILLGGSIAVFYITGFATFQLYEFVSHGIVWAFMIVVTLLALSLALQQNNALLSVVGTLGGLGTPFMLYTGSGSLVSLILYTSLILAGAGAIYFRKGWRSLLWTMLGAGWLVMTVALAEHLFSLDRFEPNERWALQLGVVFIMVVLWILPVIRQLLSYRNPAQWPDPVFLDPGGEPDPAATWRPNTNVQAMAVIVPVGTILISMGIWERSWEFWGLVALVASLLTGFSYLPLRDKGLKQLATVHGYTGLLLLTLSLFLLLEGELLIVMLALEALGLKFIASRNDESMMEAGSHLLFAVLGLWLMERLFDYPVSSTPIFNLDSLTELLVISIGGLAIPWLSKNETAARVYLTAAHLAFLGWLLKEFVPMDNGQALVTVSWGIYAIALLIPGFIRNRNGLRMAGMATIFLVVGKLFIIDLSKLEAIWRILLFIGFGAAFLMLGYYLQQRWGIDEITEMKQDSKQPEEID